MVLGKNRSPSKATATRRPSAVGVVALESFWGRSNGGLAAYDSLEGSLRALKLEPRELRALRLNLPIPETQGTTAARIARAARLLEILEGE